MDVFLLQCYLTPNFRFIQYYKTHVFQNFWQQPHTYIIMLIVMYQLIIGHMLMQNFLPKITGNITSCSQVYLTQNTCMRIELLLRPFLVCVHLQENVPSLILFSHIHTVWNVYHNHLPVKNLLLTHKPKCIVYSAACYLLKLFDRLWYKEITTDQFVPYLITLIRLPYFPLSQIFCS